MPAAAAPMTRTRGPSRRGSRNHDRVAALEDFRVVELAKDLLFVRLVLRNRPADPGRVHVVLDADVFAGDVTAPGAATEARRLWHAVGERAGVASHVRLPHHDAADRR